MNIKENVGAKVTATKHSKMAMELTKAVSSFLRFSINSLSCFLSVRDLSKMISNCFIEEVAVLKKGVFKYLINPRQKSAVPIKNDKRNTNSFT